MVKLDEFTRQYVETALWSSNDDHDQPLDKNYGHEDIDDATLAQMIADCAAFQFTHGDRMDRDRNQDRSDGGHDFWLTRNGHGAGFWDGDWGKHDGDILSGASKQFGEVNLYVTDAGDISAL